MLIQKVQKKNVVEKTTIFMHFIYRRLQTVSRQRQIDSSRGFWPRCSVKSGPNVPSTAVLNLILTSPRYSNLNLILRCGPRQGTKLDVVCQSKEPD